MPKLSQSAARWCAADPPDCSGLLRNGGTPCCRIDECHAAEGIADGDLECRRLQPGQPLLLIYSEHRPPREVFGEVRLLLEKHELVRLFLDDGTTCAILLQARGRGWHDLTNGVSVRVVEELSGPQLSRFMLYRDYAASGCATDGQPSLKGLRASA